MDKLEDLFASSTDDKTIKSFNLLVPIYLFLLVFFVLLNTISISNNQKTNKLIKSINTKFYSNKAPLNLSAEQASAYEFYKDIIVDNTKYIDIGRRFKILENIDEDEERDIIIIIPLEEFYIKDSSDIENDYDVFFSNIIKILKNPNLSRIANYNISIYADANEEKGLNLLSARLREIESYLSDRNFQVKPNLVVNSESEVVMIKLIFAPFVGNI